MDVKISLPCSSGRDLYEVIRGTSSRNLTAIPPGASYGTFEFSSGHAMESCRLPYPLHLSTRHNHLSLSLLPALAGISKKFSPPTWRRDLFLQYYQTFRKFASVRGTNGSRIIIENIDEAVCSWSFLFSSLRFEERCLISRSSLLSIISKITEELEFLSQV